MNVHQLQHRYDVLHDPALFDATLASGLALPIEIIDDELSHGIETAGLDPSDYHVPLALRRSYCLHNGFSVKWHDRREIDRGYPVMGFTSYVDAYRLVEGGLVAVQL